MLAGRWGTPGWGERELPFWPDMDDPGLLSALAADDAERLDPPGGRSDGRLADA